MTDDAAAGPAPRPGSLEWLADQQPDAIAVVDARTGVTTSRRAHDEAAGALADALAAEHGIGAGSRIALRLPAGPELLTAQFALAKLGAAPLMLPADGEATAARTLAATAGCALMVTSLPLAAVDGSDVAVLPAAALPALIERHAGGPRRLSGEQPAPDGVQADAGTRPRLVLRTRTAERIARLAAPIGDLLARVALPPNGVHLLGPGADGPEHQFWASVALVTGGRVVTQPATDAAALLAALAGHGVTSAVLRPEDLRALVALPPTATDEADLTALQRVLVGGALDAALVAAAADLLGDDVLHQVHASAQTGPFAHADADALGRDAALAATALQGVEVAASTRGELLVTSPLAADGALGDATMRRGWPAPGGWLDAPVPSGYAGRVTAQDGLIAVDGPVR